LTTLVESLLAWAGDPEESARLPQRLHDLIDLAEAELTAESEEDGRDVAARRERARARAIIDFVAALTDGQAVALMDALSGRSGQLWTDALVL
jgi:dGTPase